MNKVFKHVSVGILIFTLLSCSAFSSSRKEAPSGKQDVRVFWVLDGSMAKESAEMYLERYLLPTSLAAMLWTDFSRQDQEVRFDTRGGYRIVRKNLVLSEPLDVFTVYGYDLIVDVSVPPPAPRSSPDSYTVRFDYSPSTAGDSGVIPQPLEQALLKGIREDGRSTGRARVDSIDYLGSGRFRAKVLIAD